MIWSARKQYYFGFGVLLHLNLCIFNNRHYKDNNKSAVQMSTKPRVWRGQDEGRLILYLVRPSVFQTNENCMSVIYLFRIILSATKSGHEALFHN